MCCTVPIDWPDVFSTLAAASFFCGFWTVLSATLPFASGVAGLAAADVLGAAGAGCASADGAAALSAVLALSAAGVGALVSDAAGAFGAAGAAPLSAILGLSAAGALGTGVAL